MGQRGPLAPGQSRTSAKNTKVSASYFPSDKGLKNEAKKIWQAVVLSMPAGYFKEADRPQLRGYCEASARLAKASKETNKKGFREIYTDGKGVMRKNPWLDIIKDSLAIINSTATKLRISKSTQISPKAAGRAAEDADNAQSASTNDPWAGLMFNDDTRAAN